MTLNTYIRLNENLRSYEVYSKIIAKVADQVMKLVPAVSKLTLLSFDPRDLYWGHLQAPTCWRQCFIHRRSEDVQQLGNESKMAIQIEHGLARYLVPESQVIDFAFDCEN